MKNAKATKATFKIGDRVKVLRIPKHLKDDPLLKTKATFKKCLGHAFQICGFQGDLLELEIGSVTGKLETIWIEPDCVELIESDR